MPCGSQPRLHHRRHRALAVGSGNVYRAKRALRMAEPRHDGADVVQAELDPELFEPEHVSKRIHQKTIQESRVTVPAASSRDSRATSYEYRATSYEVAFAES